MIERDSKKYNEYELKLKSLFDSIDINGDGVLSYEEIHNRYERTIKNLDKLINLADKD